MYSQFFTVAKLNFTTSYKNLLSRLSVFYLRAYFLSAAASPYFMRLNQTTLPAAVNLVIKRLSLALRLLVSVQSTSYLVALFFKRSATWGAAFNQAFSSLWQPLQRKHYFLGDALFIKNFTTNRTFIRSPALVTTAFSVFYRSMRSIIIPLVISLVFFIILLDFFSVDFLRQTGVWAVFGFLGFWLFSSFNFFIKRYRFGKFTSAIQRFWKRTNSYFWLIEGFLLGLFIYYYLNSAQEPLYMYDESNLNQNFLLSLVASYQSYLVLLFILFYTFYLLLALPTFKSTQQIFHLGLMTLVYTYIYLLENYQVYYLLTSFYENYWVYDAENVLWSLEVDVPRVRVKNQYFYIALVLKYWHFVFIYLSWLFVAMKCYEKKQLSYLLLSLSSQNILILFALNFVLNIQWLKWMFKRFSETAYYWFFTAPNEFTFLQLFQEIIAMCLLYSSFLTQ